MKTIHEKVFEKQGFEKLTLKCRRSRRQYSCVGCGWDIHTRDPYWTLRLCREHKDLRRNVYINLTYCCACARLYDLHDRQAVETVPENKNSDKYTFKTKPEDLDLARICRENEDAIAVNVSIYRSDGSVRGATLLPQGNVLVGLGVDCSYPLKNAGPVREIGVNIKRQDFQQTLNPVSAKVLGFFGHRAEEYAQKVREIRERAKRIKVEVAAYKE